MYNVRFFVCNIIVILFSSAREPKEVLRTKPTGPKKYRHFSKYEREVTSDPIFDFSRPSWWHDGMLICMGVPRSTKTGYGNTPVVCKGGSWYVERVPYCFLGITKFNRKGHQLAESNIK